MDLNIYKVADRLIRDDDLDLLNIIGINESILLRRIHHWQRGATRKFQDRTWFYKTYMDWHKEIRVLSIRTLKRAVTNLRGLGVIHTARINNFNPDKTLSYAIDYERIVELVENQKMTSANLTLMNDDTGAEYQPEDTKVKKTSAKKLDGYEPSSVNLTPAIPKILLLSEKEFSSNDIRFPWEIDRETESDEHFEYIESDECCELPKAQVSVVPTESVTTPFRCKTNWYGTPNLLELRALKVYDVARLLNLNTIRSGGQTWTICPNHRDSEPSLNLNRDRKNYESLAHCYVCESNFDPVGLVEKFLGLKFNVACNWLAEHFHIQPPKPAQLCAPKKTLPPDAIKYWKDHAMRIEDLPNGVYFSPKFYKEFGGAWMFPHPIMQNKWIGRLLYPPPGKRKYRLTKGVKNAIYKLGSQNPKRVYMPEGMSDTVTLNYYTAWSVWTTMCGAGSWPEGDLSEFRTVDEVVIFPDADGPGKDGAARKAGMIRQYGCKVYIITLPEGIHDVSDFFAKGGTVEQLKNLVDDVLPKETENLKDVFGTAWWDEASAPTSYSAQ